MHHSCTVSSPIFENAFHYSLSHSHLQNPIRKMVQFPIDIACRADLPPPVTSRAPRSNVLTFRVLTLSANVTAKFYIFFTISIQFFKNTGHRPLPLNHLRKMPDKTVKFRVDFAPAVPRRHLPSPFGRGWGEGDLSFPSVAKGRWAPSQHANPSPTCANLRTA